MPLKYHVISGSCVTVSQVQDHPVRGLRPLRPAMTSRGCKWLKYTGQITNVPKPSYSCNVRPSSDVSWFIDPLTILVFPMNPSVNQAVCVNFAIVNGGLAASLSGCKTGIPRVCDHLNTVQQTIIC